MHPDHLAAVNAAIKALGGLTKVSKRYNITISAVQLWRKNGIPTARLKQVGTDSGVGWERLSPQAYG